MADNESSSGILGGNPFASLFFTTGPGVNLKLREKIALAQMMQKRAYPKTFGEGLGAIGDAIGDRGIALALERQDKESQDAAAKLGAPAAPADAVTTPPVRRSYASPDEDVVETPPITAPPPPVARTVTPPATAVPPPTAAPAPGNLPPTGEPGNTGATTFAPPLQTTPMQRDAAPPGTVRSAPPLPPPGQQSMMPPPGTPVMAMGGDPGENAPPPDARSAIAMALVQQQNGQAVPPPNPTLTAATPPPGGQPNQGIQPAPPDARVQLAQAQPNAVPGYVPPERADPTGAPIIAPGRRELELNALLARNQGNPYAAQSPAAIELKQLQDARAQRQTEANEIFKANIARTTKREEQRQTGLMDQAKREVEYAKERQQLIQYGQGRVAEGGGPGAEAQPDPRLGTPQSPQRSGIPTTPPVPAGVVPQKWAELHAPEHVKALSAVEGATPDFQKMLDVIKLARDHPGKDWGTGLTSGWAPKGTSPYDFGQVVEQLKGKNFLSGYQKLKGGGAVSEIEGTKTEQSQARLNPGGSTDAFNAGLDDLEKNIRSDLELIQRKVNQPVTAWQRSPDDPPAPDKGQVVGGFSDGKTRVYMGGDPRDIKNSWRVTK